MKGRPRIFLPNRLSVLRIILGLTVPILLFCPQRGMLWGRPWTLWSAFILFVMGALTDFWDGWIARKHCLETPLGRVLDPTADKIFVLSIMGSFSALGIYSYWYLVPIFVREIAVSFCRLVWLKQGQAIAAEKAGKVKLTVQVVSVSVSFVFLAFPSNALSYINQAGILAAMLLTVYSGFFFFKHNLPRLGTPEFARCVGSLGGIGYLKPFPGTYGTLMGMMLVPFVRYDLLLHLGTIVGVTLLAYVFLRRSKIPKEEDPLEVVIDELCGILVVFWGVPFTWQSCALGFILFRLFDVSKLFPINWLERLKGAKGILLDDLGAGLYAWLVLKVLFR